MSTPQIVVPSEGFHNKDLERARGRLLRGNTYKDCSTIMIVPAIAPIPPKVVQSWMGIMAPMNQRFTRIFVENMEVGQAYNAAIELILSHPELSKWKYLLTVETDNMVPPDGLLKLIEDIESGPKYDAVGALYFCKGPGGMPMAYGRPDEMPRSFIPFLPPDNSVTPVCGLGMGCTLFRLSQFKKVPPPWFETIQRYTPGVGSQAFTQDLAYFSKAAGYGLRFACSTRVLVGHYDYSGSAGPPDTTW